MGRALTTDLYELNMVASYLRRGMVAPATFSLFVRTLPPSRGFLVAAGLEDCLAYLASSGLDDEEIAWLREAGFDERAVDALASLRFTGDVFAVPEGRVVLANEPILEVTAPLPEAQFVETYLLNQISFQTAFLTKAARCRLAAPDIDLVDFALRRTQGVDAGMAVARLSAVAGFVATSNVEAARRFGLRAAGTMAHSYIEAFDSESDAFRAFAEDNPGATTFLVDTYDTLAGVAAAIEVIRERNLTGSLAVRLDSGDLVALARHARRMLDDAGLPHVRILVSGGVDEHELARYARERAPIDGAGIGTRVGVSADAPYLDTVYKLVQYGDRPVVKLSAGKSTLPGPKQVWRRIPIEEDVLALRGEAGQAGFDPLLQPVMRGGVRTGSPDTMEEARTRLAHDLDALPTGARDLEEPVAPHVRVSDALQSLTKQVTDEIRRGPARR
jgi:nicotinate phosphoribosyltransferase